VLARELKAEGISPLSAKTATAAKGA
jgi:hypothetical protein